MALSPFHPCSGRLESVQVGHVVLVAAAAAACYPTQGAHEGERMHATRSSLAMMSWHSWAPSWSVPMSVVFRWLACAHVRSCRVRSWAGRRAKPPASPCPAPRSPCPAPRSPCPAPRSPCPSLRAEWQGRQDHHAQRARPCALRERRCDCGETWDSVKLETCCISCSCCLPSVRRCPCACRIALDPGEPWWLLESMREHIKSVRRAKHIHM